MKRQGLLLTAALVFSGTMAYADTISISDKIIGIEAGYAGIEANTYGTFGEADHTSNDVEYGIRFGAENRDWRTLLSMSYYDNSDEDQQYFKGLAEVSYFVIQEGAFKPFVGLNVGYMNYQTYSLDENSFLYGGQAGFTFRISENVELDVSYRYSLANSDQIDHIDGAVFGLNYVY